MKVAPAQFAFLRDLLRRRTGVVIDEGKQYLVIARLLPIVRQRSIPSIETLVDRLSGRRVCSAPEAHVYHVRSRPPRTEGRCDQDGTALDHRVDDRPETVRRRLEGQMAPMFEVIDHYAERGVLCAIREDQAVDTVTSDLLAAIERCRRRPGI